jgi:hypothetical protein
VFFGWLSHAPQGLQLLTAAVKLINELDIIGQRGMSRDFIAGVMRGEAASLLVIFCAAFAVQGLHRFSITSISAQLFDSSKEARRRRSQHKSRQVQSLWYSRADRGRWWLLATPFYASYAQGDGNAFDSP